MEFNKKKIFTIITLTAVSIIVLTALTVVTVLNKLKKIYTGNDTASQKVATEIQSGFNDYLVSDSATPTPTMHPYLTSSPTPTRIYAIAPIINVSSPTPTSSVTPTETPTATPTSATPTATSINLNVALLIFNPKLPSKNNIRLIDYMHWNSPQALADLYILEVRNVSHNIVNYSVVQILETDSIPVKMDGFIFTPDSYLDCISGKAACRNTTDFADYENIIRDFGICEKVNNREIDELWMFGAPWFGFYEANMTGPGSFWTNGPIIGNNNCSRSIPIMGFSYERGVSEMLEDLGHRSEGTLSTFMGNQLNHNGYGWSNYRTNIGTDPSENVFGCGDIHHPPNASSDYLYGISNSVNSNCEDWNNYPDRKNIIQNINCNLWECNSLGYFRYWFSHLPHFSGTDSNGKFNNWWKYISNTM